MDEMVISQLDNILNDVKGDIIDFRIYSGKTFALLVNLAKKHNRFAVGIDTFRGLPQPGTYDVNEDRYAVYPKGYATTTQQLAERTIERISPHKSNYKIYAGPTSTVLETLENRIYALAVVDLLHYEPTRQVLDYIYDKMAPNGIILVHGYNPSKDFLASKGVSEFLQNVSDNVTVVQYDRDVHAIIIRKLITQPTIVSDIKETEAVTKLTHKSPQPHAPITVALVLRTGGNIYDHRYVNTVATNILKNTTLDINIACLTNDATGIDRNLVSQIIPLKHNYKGWWSKIELFRPGIFTTDRVFFIDLDTVIVANIDELLLNDSVFSGIRDLYHLHFMQTGIMSWNPKYNHQVYEQFVPRSLDIMNHYAAGDSKWIRENLHNYDYLQDKFPHRIVSFKAHCLNKHTKAINIPKGASIICFHGIPRPHTITDKKITQYWKYE